MLHVCYLKVWQSFEVLLSILLLVLQTILADIQCVGLIEYENPGFVQQHWGMLSQPRAWRRLYPSSLFSQWWLCECGTSFLTCTERKGTEIL